MSHIENPIEDWAIALGAFQAYLDYVCRYEINEIFKDMQEGSEPDVQKLKDDIIKHVASDVTENMPQVFGDLGARLRKVAEDAQKSSND